MTNEEEKIILELYSEEDDAIEIIEEGDWIDEGKYSYCYDVFKYNDRYFQASKSRSGSYFTDYDYSDPEIIEVVRTEKTVVQVIWKPI